jgi:hypothetical protein
MVVGGSNKEGVRAARKKMKDRRKRYIVVSGRARGAVYAEDGYSIVLSDNRSVEETIKRLNSNKSLHTIVTTGTIKKAKRIIEEVKDGTKHGL